MFFLFILNWKYWNFQKKKNSICVTHGSHLCNPAQANTLSRVLRVLNYFLVIYFNFAFRPFPSMTTVCTWRYPPGHGDVFPSLRNSGKLDALLSQVGAMVVIFFFLFYWYTSTCIKLYPLLYSYLFPDSG